MVYLVIRNATECTLHCITLLPPTENAGGGADVHCGSELLHEHELLGVGVEDHHGHAAVTPGKDHHDNHDDNYVIVKDYLTTLMRIVYDNNHNDSYVIVKGHMMTVTSVMNVMRMTVMVPHEVPSPAGSARLAVHHPHGGEVAGGGERLQAHLLYLLHPD